MQPQLGDTKPLITLGEDDEGNSQSATSNGASGVPITVGDPVELLVEVNEEDTICAEKSLQTDQRNIEDSHNGSNNISISQNNQNVSTP